ncbi:MULTISPECIES: NUDIX hydrolase [Streptomyces]|uniref:Possible hydrolase mutT1 n=1 Tax=Streptomyces venezuelae (strain ATCC 10712 / CBS 650.69 / DSM 40230 / JCM 4526 / NBRC 13096 / PD 04745) TaxID=953739 RepID=F2RFN6_STRVP|nr:NUDIX hydrolase [Streptomyces venezuelae]APE22927.1 DNA mismatch repair protein MutT [Streptomyces venezuelae]QES00307.1 NUDIX hydrolase [Streptomyces venezuelae ATCC 10712]CCA57188.1 Possible hydrolase mutT1 [Streptomyces venezuelae ATCC 10712]
MSVPESPILAAGCVLWRRSRSGHGIEIAVVFRPKWSDWSHPKGKLKSGEGARAAAVREVREETGMTCALGVELPTVRYRVQGRAKEVRYWAAEATGGSFAPNREVTRLLWLTPEAARTCLTQDRDKDLIGVFLRRRAAEGGRVS